jgi:hypothetical protein
VTLLYSRHVTIYIYIYIYIFYTNNINILILHTAWQNSHTGLHNITRWSSHFIYGFHYFCLQSTDNRQMRWHNKLIQSMLICISFMAAVTEMLELHQRNTISNHIRNNPTDVCLQWCTAIWRKQMHSCHQHTLAVEDAMCRMKRNSHVLYALIHQLAPLRSHREQASLRQQSGIHHTRIKGTTWTRATFKG